jgi:iron complex transport system substrate-binding protein
MAPVHRRPPWSGLAGLLVLFAAAGAGAAPAAPPPQRLVSLAPNVTELVFAAGAGDRLVGVSEFSDYPVAARRLPHIGNAFRVDEERLLALRPDLVLAWRTGTPQSTIDRVRRLGVGVLVLDTQRLDDIAGAIERIGAVVGTRAVAAPAAARLRAEIAVLGRARPGERPVRVFIEIDDQPLYTVTGRHVVDEIVRRCGGRNVFAELPGVASAVDLEAVLARDPELIIVADDTAADPQRAWARWPSLSAVRNQRVVRIRGDLLTRATPRIVAGARAVCAAIAGTRTTVSRGPVPAR